ncbi:hypothetical protein SAMN05720781_3297 [Fibrobacter sp. UWT3]|uniref:hypothetical protein n=1 Tax=Fibrobacter sp. UWT3 TaxID=1896225 RepID=UPI000BC4168A|nr:hypothetical protein [Fibrobacter sp. UWT3]SOE80113.1 hypothetical protein SAMN05720781_3276 [Fibrobacter sp. UWT3]SOE80130.1 hypothetical protein SAMN05720781_3297 [Fibrobacter sp. UWT3]
MLDLDTLDSEFSRIVKSADGKTSVAPQLAKAYDDYAKCGVILGADLSAGGDKSLLESAFTVCNPSEGTAANMAARLCAYWQGLPKPGIPSHGGVTVVSVVPTFAAVQPAVLAVITDLVKEQATSKQEVQKPYKKLFGAIETVLKTAICTVTETMPTTPPSPSPFPETLQ